MTQRIIVPTGYLAVGACVVMATTMFYTYITCYLQDQCVKLPHLPTISETWEYPPGNYLSRFVVGNVAIQIGLGQFAIYWLNVQQNVALGWQHLLFALGYIASIFFSWVGAICDSTNMQCRGNDLIHSCCAVLFFILYDGMAVVMTYYKFKKEGCKKMSTMALGVLATICTVSKVRWIPNFSQALGYGWGDETPLAIFEWSDVFAIMIWTSLYIYQGNDSYYWTVWTKDGKNDPKDAEVRNFFPAQFTANISVIWVYTTLALSLGFYIIQGRLKQGDWPMISDTWVYPPGNWLSRWAVVGGTTMAQFSQLCLFFMELNNGSTSIYTRVAITTLAMVSILGLTIVGCVNEEEDATIHYIGALIFFVGYSLYMVFHSYLVDDPLPSVWQKAKAITSTVLTFVRYFLLAYIVPGADFHSLLTRTTKVGDFGESAIAVIEWVTTVIIVSYFYWSIKRLGNTSMQTGLALVQKTTTKRVGNQKIDLGLPLLA